MSEIIPIHQMKIEGAPTSGRARSYHVPAGIDGANFDLRAMTPERREAALRDLSHFAERKAETFLGFQANQELKFDHLAGLLNLSTNNIGDPFSSSKALPDGYFTLNTKWVARTVLDYFARLWNASHPHRVAKETRGWEDSFWGYVLSMGSTEGNLVAIRNARDYLSGVRLRGDGPGNVHYLKPWTGGRPNEFHPVLFYSEAAHYSVRKLAHVLQFPTFSEVGREYYPHDAPAGGWPAAVPADEHGRIDIDKLVEYATFFIERRFPIAVVFNYGTTWTGAYDNVAECVRRLEPILRKHDMYERDVTHRSRKGRRLTKKRKGFWYHVDGALGATLVPYYRLGAGPTDFEYPDFDFRLDIQSIVVSGHKWLGAPWPCGVFMTKNRYLLTNDIPQYLGSSDSTLAGSRNAFSAVVLWDVLARASDQERGEQVHAALRLAAWAREELSKTFGEDRVRQAPGSVAVRFPRPADWIVNKYSLSSTDEGESHIFVMPHVRKHHIEALIRDMTSPEAGAPGTPAPAGGNDRPEPAPQPDR